MKNVCFSARPAGILTLQDLRFRRAPHSFLGEKWEAPSVLCLVLYFVPDALAALTAVRSYRADLYDVIMSRYPLLCDDVLHPRDTAQRFARLQQTIGICCLPEWLKMTNQPKPISAWLFSGLFKLFENFNVNIDRLSILGSQCQAIKLSNCPWVVEEETLACSSSHVSKQPLEMTKLLFNREESDAQKHTGFAWSRQQRVQGPHLCLPARCWPRLNSHAVEIFRQNPSLLLLSFTHFLSCFGGPSASPGPRGS